MPLVRRPRSVPAEQCAPQQLVGVLLVSLVALVLAALIGLLPVRASAMPTLQAQASVVDLGPWLTRWVDPTAHAGLDEAQRRQAQAEFKPIGSLGSAGYTRAAHWYMVSLQRERLAGEHWVLAIGAPYLDDVQVWLQASDGPARHVQLGDRHLGAGRPLSGRLHALNLTLPEAAGDSQALRLWLRVRSASALNVSVELWQPDAYVDHETMVAGAWGGVLGLLLLAALTQLLFGLWLRDAIMQAFAFFIGALFLLHFGTSGMALLVLPQLPSWYSDLVVGSGSLCSVAAASLLTMQVLDIRQQLPRWRWLYLGPALLALALLPLTVTDLYAPVAAAFNLWGMVLSLVNIGVSLWVWQRQRGRLYLMYAVAAVCFGAGVIVTVLALLGLLPANGLTRTAYQAGIVVYLLVMLVAMAMRMASLRHDKLLAQERVQEERRFAAIVAHEFRNPLASIDRSANLLQLIPELTPDQTALRLGGIRRQVGRLVTLVDSFLHVEAGEHRPLQAQAAPVAMGPWLQALRQELDDDARSRLSIRAEPEDLRARFDAGLVALALHNLIDNALRYTPEHRSISVTACVGDGGRTLQLVVADQGPGLSADDLRHLGQPYYRGATALGRQGTGLGYYFCQRIAQMHGGQLRATTVLPHGLTVTLSLPQPG